MAVNQGVYVLVASPVCRALCSLRSSDVTMAGHSFKEGFTRFYRYGMHSDDSLGLMSALLNAFNISFSMCQECASCGTELQILRLTDSFLCPSLHPQIFFILSSYSILGSERDRRGK